MIVEMGIIAPFLWLLWTGSLVYYGWKIVRRVKGTRFAPIAIAILWYAFFLLYPLTYDVFSPYQDYMSNTYLWLLVGMLFRLPDLLESSAASVPALPSP